MEVSSVHLGASLLGGSRPHRIGQGRNPDPCHVALLLGAHVEQSKLVILCVDQCVSVVVRVVLFAVMDAEKSAIQQ